MAVKTSTFAGQLKLFAQTVDIVDDGTFDSVRQLVYRYVVTELGALYFELLYEESVGNGDRQTWLRTLWSSDERNHFWPVLSPDGRYSNPVAQAFDLGRPMWLVSTDKTPLEQADNYEDQWSHVTDMPRYQSAVDQPARTVVIIPLHYRRPLGVCYMEVSDCIQITDVARVELQHLGAAISILFELWDENRARGARNEAAIRELADFLSAARFPNLVELSELPTPTRYVNVVVATAGSDEPVAAERPLTTGSDYELMIRIGRYVDGNLLPQSEAYWPDDLLPERGVWLRAALILDGARVPDVRPFFLPPEGESFTCDCSVDGKHAPSCVRRSWVRFPLRIPDLPAVVEGELVVYYQAAIVVALRVRLPTGTDARDGPQATVIGRLTSTFNDLGKLAGRTASVVVSPSSSRVVVNGSSFVDNPFTIGARAADTSAINARTALYASHFELRDRRLYSLYDGDFGKAYPQYEQDLRRLAREGAALYAGLFSPADSDNVAFTLPGLIRHEARTRGRPPVIQVIDDRFDEHAVLWAVIYDLPVGADIARYEPCPSVRDFGPGSTAAREVPALCPYDRDHQDRGNVLCPFGFWGLSCVVEQPPTVGRDLESVVYAGPDDLAVLVAAGASLDGRLTERHLQRLRAELSDRRVTQPRLATEEDLAAALGPETMDIVYFYCHCGYDRRSGQAAADRYLELGGYTVEPIDVNMWARTAWPYPHWPHRRPLVVLNGCHTTEVTSGTLNSFVPAFTQWGGASGVLGTEIALEQGLASWAMEEVLARVSQGQPIGAALHHTRWAMLRRGNLMGLAYTSYCLANLVLRPATTSRD